ncbi:MAG TPA: SurA N-terminal domain-containing protein [Candidatus Binatia bacterium]|nr:SurA N-terminal domain-containing protein [Candidatus Binatia bacterium]
MQFTIACLLLSLTASLPLPAGEVIDGVVASVNRQPILLSDWQEAIAFEAFMQQKPQDAMSKADRLLALQHLIDRELLKREMGDPGYMAPSDEVLARDVAQLRAQVPQGSDDVSWRQLLAGYGLNENLLREHLRTQFQVMNFVEVRLRPNVHVNDEEIDSYYRNQLLADLRSNGAAAVPLAEVKSRIRELLTQQRIDELLDAWLHNLRQQEDIHSSISIPGVNTAAEAPGVAGGN